MNANDNLQLLGGFGQFHQKEHNNHHALVVTYLCNDAVRT